MCVLARRGDGGTNGYFVSACLDTWLLGIRGRVEPKASKLQIEASTREAKYPGRFRDVSAGSLESGLDHLPLRAHVAALLPQSGEGTVPAMRSPALMGLLASLQPGEAATYAAARSLIDWHSRHRFCAISISTKGATNSG